MAGPNGRQRQYKVDYFDALEWQKRRAFWSVSKALRTANFTDANLENAGVLLKRKMLQDYTIITVLPARRFAIRDRLPELKRDTLKHLAQSQFTATAMFDTLIMDQPSDENLWLPRIYRVLDTIEDLAPEDVQEITVLYDSPQHIPPLRAYLPLPKTADDSRQPGTKKIDSTLPGCPDLYVYSRPLGKTSDI